MKGNRERRENKQGGDDKNVKYKEIIRVLK